MVADDFVGQTTPRGNTGNSQINPKYNTWLINTRRNKTLQLFPPRRTVVPTAVVHQMWSYYSWLVAVDPVELGFVEYQHA